MELPDTHVLSHGLVFHVLLLLLQLLPLVTVIDTNLNIVLTATLSVIAGAYRSIRPVQKGETETMTKADAQKFPLVGSCVLFGMFLLFKYLPKDVLNGLLTVYFVFLGAMAICATFTPLFAKMMPKRVALTRIYFGTIPTIKYVNEEGPYEVSFDVAELTTGAAAIAFCKWYYDTKHFLANNVLGLSFALQGIEFLTLDSIQIGIILLVGLFFYDIFWVFFTPVMVSVAKSFDAIKLLFPRGPVNVLDSSKRPFSAGWEILCPRALCSLDFKNGHATQRGGESTENEIESERVEKKPSLAYFWAVAFGYALGLVTTIAVMNIFEAAQPALLYIVPGLLLTTFIRAVFAGEVRKVFYFDEKVGSVSGEIAIESSQHED